MRVDHLEVTNSITVKHPDAPFGISIISTPSGGGIWIGNETFVAIHNINGQVCLTVGRTDNNEGHAFAIYIDEKGEPGLQICRPGKKALQLGGDQLELLFGDYPTNRSGEEIKKGHPKPEGG